MALAERGIPPGRLRDSWKGNIKMEHTGIGWDGVNWIHLPWDNEKWEVVVDMIVNFHIFWCVCVCVCV